MTRTMIDIDAQLMAAHWRHLHAVRAEDIEQTKRTMADLNLLLEARHRLLARDAASSP